MKQTFELQISDLRKKTFTLYYDAQTGNVRLVGYTEEVRESTRHRKYSIIHWYNWYNQRDRHQKEFISIDQIELPHSVKQQFVNELIAHLTFITTEK